MIVLDLRECGVGHEITPAFWTSCAEAAAVTFERFHSPPPPPHKCTVFNAGTEAPVELVWAAADSKTRSTHANELDATEAGAYAVAVATVHALDGWCVAGRAHHASGADWLMMKNENAEAFVKLEVSGIAAGVGSAGHARLRSRLTEKIAQVRKGDLERPGIAVVVGFELSRVLISEVQP